MTFGRSAIALVALAASAAPARAESAVPGIDAAVRVDLVPDGSIRQGTSGSDPDSYDLPQGYAIGAEVRYRLASSYAIGIAPRYVRFGDTIGQDYQLDLAARLVGQRALSSTSRFELHFAFGYSIGPIPGDAENPDANGFIVGTGVGLEQRVAARVFLVAEVGYQYGFQNRTYVVHQSGGSTYETQETSATRFVHTGIGVRTRF